MRAWPLLLAALTMALALAGCGDFPRPFQGNPGPVGRRLVVPPPPLLAVPPPATALLTDAASRSFASDLATALAARTVPAVAQPWRPGDWRLEIGATLSQDQVIPRYTVIDPAKHKQGSMQGKPVAARAWAEGDTPALKEAANTDAPAIAALLTDIDARLKRSNPASLMNRPARVYFSGVVDAPSDGNVLLGQAMRTDLAALGVALQPGKAGADFSVIGEVKVTPAKASPTGASPTKGSQVRVELQWVVTDAGGRESGRVVQLNEVPASTIEPSWNEVAPVIAEQAAAGVRQLIEKARQAP
jgi:hypothetical protein